MHHILSKFHKFGRGYHLMQIGQEHWRSLNRAGRLRRASPMAAGNFPPVTRCRKKSLGSRLMRCALAEQLSDMLAAKFKVNGNEEFFLRRVLWGEMP